MENPFHYFGKFRVRWTAVDARRFQFPISIASVIIDFRIFRDIYEINDRSQTTKFHE